MNKIFDNNYKNKGKYICKCKTTKKHDLIRSEGYPLRYPLDEKLISKTFQIKYGERLSSTTKLILNSFQNKYIYYAIDDIVSLLNSNPNERDNLLQILYSCMLSLHNEFSINFFDIWIDSIYFNNNFEGNRFLKSKVTNKTSNLTISIKLHYFKRMPTKKPDPIW